MKKSKLISILVTGADGQLGRCIKDLESQYPNLKMTFTNRQDLDITNKHEVFDYFNQNSFDYCINCAAYTAVDKAESEPDKAHQVNAEGPKNLALACKAYGVVLIHISTDFVFDGNKKEPYTEEDIPNPVNVYGVTKLKGEDVIQQLLDKYFIIRTSWLYSEYGHNFVKTMLRLGEIRDEIDVVSDQIGAPTYAGDLAQVLLNIISRQQKDYGIYHYCNRGEVSWYDFAQAILRGKHVKVTPIPSERYKTEALRPSYSVLDISKIVQELKVKIEDSEKSLYKCLKNMAKI
ncbi:dTDP-4-dehydrorhamnose reductase [Gaetbulibacter saemankumensis]|uniref:dTDP-4-dehydrorhamnose reductase n=1 Tax=Gaetbulibacter saemankumensis TaxID=311208 RepID=UPI000422F9A7|nr:dTDP-4-dehydrorhamnose reductase [Gaetbulibacter saemankumensis]